MLQQRSEILSASTKTQWSQINKYFLKKELLQLNNKKQTTHKEDQHGIGNPHRQNQWMTSNHSCHVTDNTGGGSLCHCDTTLNYKKAVL